MFVCLCRYYGESQPTADVSLTSLKYLSSRQALADFAYFQLLMVGNRQYNISGSNKWVVLGGSYSGALAAWFRLLYPQLVVGAIATSAPVLAKVDFVEYVEVTAASLASTGHGRREGGARRKVKERGELDRVCWLWVWCGW